MEYNEQYKTSSVNAFDREKLLLSNGQLRHDITSKALMMLIPLSFNVIKFILLNHYILGLDVTLAVVCLCLRLSYTLQECALLISNASFLSFFIIDLG